MPYINIEHDAKFCFRRVYQKLFSFFDYNVTVSISVTDNTTLKFPTVTICNLNRVHCGRLLKRINESKDVRLYFFLF